MYLYRFWLFSSVATGIKRRDLLNDSLKNFCVFSNVFFFQFFSTFFAIFTFFFFFSLFSNVWIKSKGDRPQDIVVTSYRMTVPGGIITADFFHTPRNITEIFWKRRSSQGWFFRNHPKIMRFTVNSPANFDFMIFGNSCEVTHWRQIYIS